MDPRPEDGADALRYALSGIPRAAVVSPPRQTFTVKDDGIYTASISPQQAYDLAQDGGEYTAVIVDDPYADEEDPVWTDV